MDSQAQPQISGSVTLTQRPYGLQQSIRGAAAVDAVALFASMLELEQSAAHRPTFNPEARYVRVRRLLVDWISELGEDYSLANTTVHAAVELLDRFLQSMDVHRTRYQLVAMACFLIAAKYEEAEERVPPVEEVNRYASEPYAKRLINQMEILVLMRLDWSLTSTSALHFLGVLHSRGALFEGDGMAYKPLVPEVNRYLRKYTDFFADLALQEYSFQRYLPSLLAAAIVLASRRSLVIRPLWNPTLQELTGWSEAEVVPVMEHLWEHYTEQFPAEAETQEASASEADKRALAAGKVSLDALPPHASAYAAEAHRARAAAAAASAGGGACAMSPSASAEAGSAATPGAGAGAMPLLLSTPGPVHASSAASAAAALAAPSAAHASSSSGDGGGGAMMMMSPDAASTAGDGGGGAAAAAVHAAGFEGAAGLQAQYIAAAAAAAAGAGAGGAAGANFSSSAINPRQPHSNAMLTSPAPAAGYPLIASALAAAAAPYAMPGTGMGAAVSGPAAHAFAALLATAAVPTVGSAPAAAALSSGALAVSVAAATPAGTLRPFGSVGASTAGSDSTLAASLYGSSSVGYGASGCSSGVFSGADGSGGFLGGSSGAGGLALSGASGLSRSGLGSSVLSSSGVSVGFGGPGFDGSGSGQSCFAGIGATSATGLDVSAPVGGVSAVAAAGGFAGGAAMAAPAGSSGMLPTAFGYYHSLEASGASLGASAGPGLAPHLHQQQYLQQQQQAMYGLQQQHYLQQQQAMAMQQQQQQGHVPGRLHLAELCVDTGAAGAPSASAAGCMSRPHSDENAGFVPAAAAAAVDGRWSAVGATAAKPAPAPAGQFSSHVAYADGHR